MKQLKLIFTTGMLLWIALSGFSQGKNYAIKGRVSNTAEQAVEAATVSLLKIKDSSVVKNEVSGADGSFSIAVKEAGDYLVQITASGFQTYRSQIVTINDQQPVYNAGQIKLSQLTQQMEGVSVSGRKPIIEQKIDRMIVNVEGQISNAGSTAMDVLEKSPGVTVDKDGAVALKGKQQVLIMLDGRPTYLGTNELANLLRSMPASSIETIEIMTNPSAKYDAAGNSGIINIKTKKNKQRGFNGSATLNYGQGVYWKTNDNFNINYRSGKFNAFANGGYSKWNGFQNLDINRQFKNPATGDINAIFESYNRMRTNSDNFTLKVGTDYYLSKKTTLGFVASGFINPELFTNSSTSYLQDPHGVTDSIVYAKSRNDNRWTNNSFNLNLRHQFDSTGKEITSDFDYVTYNSKTKQNLMNSTFDPKWDPMYNELLRGDLPVNINIFTGKVDYSQNIFKSYKFETGLKTSFVNTSNSAFYYIVEQGAELPDLTKTNKFNYKENINAAYINLNRQFKKFGVQAGLRYEHTTINGLQYGNPTVKDSSFKRTYGNFFPTVYISYKAAKNHQFGLNYGRRIDRPNYQDLNPFLFFLDKYTYQSGNPFMLPQYTDNIELSHTFKEFLTTTANYSYTTNFQTETFEQAKNPNGEENYATIVRQGNIGFRQNAGLSVSVQYPVKKWWTMILYTNINYSHYRGEINKEMLDVEATNWMVNFNNQLKFKNGWSAEMSGWYRSKGIEGQIMIQPMGQVYIGGAKQVLKGKGTVKLSLRDVFYTQKVKGSINFENTMATFRNVRDSRVANISFTWRFGKPMKEQRSRKTGGASEELNRIKNGSSS